MQTPALPSRVGFVRDDRGTAAIEFAAVAMLLVVILGNAVDFGVYQYRSMQVEEAAQVGAQTAWKTCNTTNLLPATQNCTTANGAAANLNAAVTTAIQSTALGTRATLASGYPAEGYYCVNSSGALESVGSLSSKPTDCSAAGNANASPGDYVQIAVTAAYSPIFPGLSVVGLWGASSISATSWMRLE
jgi:Flp pilus assembly protein TadG